MRSNELLYRIALGVLLALAFAGCGGSSASPTAVPVPTATSPPFVPGALGVTVLPSTGPRELTRKAPVITVHLRVRGLHLDTRHIGGTPEADHGHVQVYLDRVPPDAHRQVDLKGVVANLASPDFSLSLPPAMVGRERGRHRLFVALARNDYILYPVRPATVAITFR